MASPSTRRKLTKNPAIKAQAKPAQHAQNPRILVKYLDKKATLGKTPRKFFLALVGRLWRVGLGLLRELIGAPLGLILATCWAPLGGLWGGLWGALGGLGAKPAASRKKPANEYREPTKKRRHHRQ